MALFLFLALATFSPMDPDFDYATSGESINNIGGIVGAYAAGTLIRALGISAWLLPVVIVLACSDLVITRSRTPLSLRIPASILLLLSAASFVALVAPDWTVATLPASGWIGHTLGADLVRQFFGLGGIVLILPILLLAIAGSAGGAGVQIGQTMVAGAIATARSAWNRTVVSATGLRRHIEGRRKRALEKQEPEPRDKPKFVAPDEPPADVEIDPAQRTSRRDDDTHPGLEIEKPEQPEKIQKAVQRTLVSTPGEYRRPDIDLLDRPSDKTLQVDEKLLRAKAQILEHKIKEYGIEGRITAVRPGPVISIYEFKPAPGIKVSKIANLEDDLALATESLSVRIVAPIPGRDVVGIEIPNKERDEVSLRTIIESPDFWSDKIKIPFAIGKDTGGQPVVADISTMPHLLVAGATGAGKSVGINSLIVSMLYRHSPNDLRMYLIDPKRLELSFYRDIPHLEGHDVVTDPHQALALLDALVREMEDRYDWMAHSKVRNLATYNKAVDAGKIPPRNGKEAARMPYLVCVVDELADLMMVTRKTIEEPIARLAQMARAAGIHLVLATQRPSVDVLTGLIKANFPTRMAFKVSSKADARVILDQQGAENLLGKGDMLFKPPTSDIPKRVHGAFVSEEEVIRVVEFWKNEGQNHGMPEPAVSEDLIQESLDRVRGSGGDGGGGDGDLDDDLLESVIDFGAQEGVISTSRIQRRFSIGYNRAARIMDALEAKGMVGPQEGAGKPRKFIGAKVPDEI